MSGLSPAESGLSARSGGRIGASALLLAETARDRGFATLAYSENPFITHYFGFDQGFEHFEEAFPVDAHRLGEELPSDHDSPGRIEALLDRVNGDEEAPFFLYLHLLRPHNPYAPPPPYAGRFGSDPGRRQAGTTRHLLEIDARGPPFDRDAIQTLIDLYDENLAYADALVGGFLASLERRGLADRTIVILTSDHGEAFGEHDRLLHSTQLFEPMLRVPLLIRIPGEPGRVDGRPIQHADLGRGLRAYFLDAQTRDSARRLLRLADAREPGAPLFSWTNARTHQVAARTAERKLVLDARSLEVVAHVDHVRDRTERENLPLDPLGRDLRERLVEKIAQWTGTPIERGERPTSDPANGPAPVSAAPAAPEIRAQLEALGYVDDRAVD